MAETKFTLRIQGGSENDRFELAQLISEIVYDELDDQWPEWCKGVLIDYPMRDMAGA